MESSIERIDGIRERKRQLIRRQSVCMLWIGINSLAFLICAISAIAHFCLSNNSAGWSNAFFALLNAFAIWLQLGNHRETGRELELLEDSGWKQ